MRLRRAFQIDVGRQWFFRMVVPILSDIWTADLVRYGNIPVLALSQGFFQLFILLLRYSLYYSLYCFFSSLLYVLKFLCSFRYRLSSLTDADFSCPT
jgi:hypothetical protein